MLRQAGFDDENAWFDVIIDQRSMKVTRIVWAIDNELAVIDANISIFLIAGGFARNPSVEEVDLWNLMCEDIDGDGEGNNSDGDESNSGDENNVINPAIEKENTTQTAETFPAVGSETGDQGNGSETEVTGDGDGGTGVLEVPVGAYTDDQLRKIIFDNTGNNIPENAKRETLEKHFLAVTSDQDASPETNS